MDKMYSVYEAKARFSELLRQVREGGRVTISYHGKAVAELRPIEPEGAGIEGRLDRLKESGVVIYGEGKPDSMETVDERPGALSRFLTDRDA